jgi:glycerol-3-phosphate O-acyltransferase
VLAARYGRIYLSFEEPISLRTFLASRRPEPADPDGEKRKMVAALAHRIVFGIDRASTVTPSALLAAVLLGHRQRGLGAKAISDRIHFLRDLAESEGARISDVLRNAPSDPTIIGPFNEAIGVFEEDGLVTHQNVGGDTIYRVVDERRQQLVFYKNNFMHLVAPRSLVAAALRSFKDQPASLTELGERTKYLSRLFKLEFIFRVGQTFEALFEDNLGWLVDRGLVIRGEGTARIAPEAHAQEQVALLADQVRDFTESYWLAAKTLHVLKAGARDRKEVLAEMMERGRAGFLEGQLQCAEAVSRPNLENALELYVELGVLSVAQKTRLALTPAGEQAVASRSLENEVARFL